MSHSNLSFGPAQTVLLKDGRVLKLDAVIVAGQVIPVADVLEWSDDQRLLEIRQQMWVGNYKHDPKTTRRPPWLKEPKTAQEAL